MLNKMGYAIVYIIFIPAACVDHKPAMHNFRVFYVVMYDLNAIGKDDNVLGVGHSLKLVS